MEGVEGVVVREGGKGGKGLDEDLGISSKKSAGNSTSVGGSFCLEDEA